MKSLFRSLIIIFLFTSCELIFSPEPELPPITSEGKGTFGCLINGEVWLPDDQFLVSAYELQSWINSDSALYIAARNVPDDQKIELYFKDFYIEDVELEFSMYPSNSAFVILGAGCVFETDSSSGYFEIIKNDTSMQIIAGTFEFTIFEECDTLHVSEGRFDLGYNYIRK